VKDQIETVLAEIRFWTPKVSCRTGTREEPTRWTWQIRGCDDQTRETASRRSRWVRG